MAVAGINKTINFQGRLLNTAGATVADGYYNMQFKIYQDGDGQTALNATGSPASSLKWTENYINNGSPTGAVMVRNGFFSVNLGSQTAFGSSIDWNQDTLWLSMNVAGSAQACTTFGTAPCAADGEMLPMKRLTATPYALNSGALNGLTSTQFVQLAQGVQLDASTNTSSIFINKTGSGNLAQLQAAGADVFTVDNGGNIFFGNSSNHSISIATSDPAVDGKLLLVSAGTGGTGSGSLGGTLMLQGGAAGGTNANGGDVVINGGTKSGTGLDGEILIGNGTSPAVSMGTRARTTGAQSLYIGSAFASGGTEGIAIGGLAASGGTSDIYIGGVLATGGTHNVSIGASGTATAGTTMIQSKGDTTIKTNGTTRATFDSTGKFTVDANTVFNNTATYKQNVLQGFNIQGSAGSYTRVANGNAGYMYDNGYALSIGYTDWGTAGSAVNPTNSYADALVLGNIGSGTNQALTSMVNAGIRFGDNLIDNGGFEFGCNGWHGGCSADATTPHTGNGADKITMASGATTGFARTSLITAKPGDIFYASGWVRASVGTIGTGGVRLCYYDKTDTLVGSCSNSTLTNPGATYTQRTVTSTAAPANTAYVTASFYNVGDGSTGGTWFFDDMYVAKATKDAPAIFRSETDSASAFQIQNATGSNTLFNVDTSGNIITLGGTGTKVGFTNSGAAATSLVCKDGSGYLTTCSTSGNGAAFVQGGNSFGADATLGTNDAFNLTLKTAGTNRLTLDQSGNLQFLQASSITTNGALDLRVDTGGAATLNLGTTNATTVNVGNASSTTLQVGSTAVTNGSTQNITVGGSAGTTGIQNVTVGSSGTAGGGTTAIQSKGSTTISTNGTTRATFDNAGKLTLDTQNILNNTTTVTNSQLLGFNVQGTAGAYTLQNTGPGGYIYNNGVAMQFGTVASSAQGAAVATTTTTNVAFELYNVANYFTATVNKGLNFGQNLVDNGDFEIGSAGWSVQTGGPTNITLSNTGTDQYAGRVGLRINKNAIVTGTIAQRTVAVHPGQTYYASGQVKTSAANTGTSSLRIVFFDSNLTNIGSTTSASTNPGTSYALRTMSATAPANAAYMALYIQTNADGNTGFWYWDNIFLTRSDREDPALFKNATDSANALTVQDAAGTNTLFNVDTSGNIVTLGGTGSKVGFTNSGASATSFVCKDGSGYMTTCNTTGNGAAFVQGGNSFGATAVLGTNDANNLTFKTAGTNRLTLDQSGNLQFQQASSITTNGALDLRVDTGGAATLNLGTTSATTINIANGTAASTNVVVGTSGSAAGGTTTIQSKAETTFATNGTNRATFASGSNTLYMGNGNASGVAASPNSFTIQGTSNSGTGAGGALTVQAGGSGASANGANLTLSGGTGGNGVNGLVVLTTPTFQTYNTGTSYSCAAGPCNIPQASVDNNAVVVVKATNSGLTLNLPNPTISGSSAYGRILYITGSGEVGSQNFTLSINGGGSVSNLISMRANASATLVWGPGDGTGDWTAAGASSSTTLQAAYDNTIQSSGGAELIVGKTSNTNGLTIRDSSVNPVNGALLSVQSSSAANLISVSSNVTEYASNPGAESYDITTPNLNGFPAGNWPTSGSATITRSTTAANIATGQGSVSVQTTAAANDGVKNTLTSTLNVGLTYNVSFSALLSSGTFSNLTVDYSKDGSGTTACTSNQQIMTKTWARVSCSFTVPSGANSSNAIWIRQATGVARTFYIDNLSVTASADQSYAADGGVDSALGTNWVAVGVGSSAAQTNGNGYEKSSSAQITTIASATSGIKNKLSVSPLASTGSTTYLYRVSAYVQTTTSALTAFKIRYSRDNGTNFTDCVDYNTQAVSVSATAWQKITCIIQTDTTAASNAHVYFEQGDTTIRTNTLYIDSFSMTLANSTTPSVQIGGGSNGGPTTLFTLDKGASAPIANDNQSLLGSMYYDTTLGKLQCYEADGWGACGSSPDVVVTLSPEFTNSVMHGTGVGTLTSDMCANGAGLSINDGTNGPAICASNEIKNFYKWTSPQPTSQPYSIYVTYQLPATFKSFASGITSLSGRVDSLTNASITYQIFRSTTGSLTACGSAVSVASGAANAWDVKTATGTADPSTCGFAANDSIVFKINVNANSDASAYIGNLNFTFSNK